ncbi:MAG: N-formylglutamate amidohydrolase [Pseudonocardiales bacterium]|nr:N-formylglutamate amidohydrolase [Pseudonocardiales bacterium]
MDPLSPVLLHVPHAGTGIPAWTRPHLLLDDASLAAETAALTDHDTDLIAAAAADRTRPRPGLLVNPVSRFVVDVERFPDGREEMAAVGMGAVYTHGTRGQRIRADDPAHHEALLAAFYRPWAAAVERAVDERVAATGRAVLVDVHSYSPDPLPYERARGPRPAFCLGTDRVHTPPALLAAARDAFGPDVALDSPFAGAYVPLSRYGTDRRVSAIMIEIRRDGYAAGTGPVVDRLAAFLADPRTADPRTADPRAADPGGPSGAGGLQGGR